MMYGKIGKYRLKENDICAQVWQTFKEGIHIWEGPIADLMLVEFLKQMSVPYVFIIAGVF